MAHNLSRKLVLKKLENLEFGTVVVQEKDQKYSFGSSSLLNASIRVNNGSFYSNLIMHGSLGAAQSYIDGEWESDQLTDLLRIIIRNESTMNQLDGSINKIPQALIDFFAKLKKNTITRAKNYIHAHYDLGNDFFKTFLDDTLMYSCALFESPDDDLYDAQKRKIKRIVEQLSVQPGDHILEIGTGWGELAIHLVQNFDCHVTTTTISEQQYEFVKNRIETLNLQDKITLLNQDYRLLQGQYDKIVSIEMIEAVGYQFFDEFFKKCDRLLKTDGLLMIQAITINEQTYEMAKEHVDFIKKYIFPGGCLPSINRIGKSVADHTNLQWLSLTDIGKNYVPTLRRWHQHFMANIDQVRELGFSEHFIRTWQYYFCYCEAGFEEEYISNVHLLWRKRG